MTVPLSKQQLLNTWKLLALLLILRSPVALSAQRPLSLSAQRIRITIPRRSLSVPAQRLNHDGVDCIVKHNYEKAESLFLRAYLYDPSDPFTLNNLGYVSELKGDINRAAKYYELAHNQESEAIIDRSSNKNLNGKPMIDALATIKDLPMKVNRMNVYAVRLLSQDRAFEAEALLTKAALLDPGNPFTRNNLATAQQMIGNFPDALVNYEAAVTLHSSALIAVTVQSSVRGKPISEVAAASANKLRARMANMSPLQMRAQMLTIRGVAALNENNWQAAKENFQAAYEADPKSGFTLNNIGYVAEHDGELETAITLYARARRAQDSNLRVGLVNHPVAPGEYLSDLAKQSHQDVSAELRAKVAAEAVAAHTKTKPLELLRRDGSPVPSASQPPSVPLKSTKPE